MRAIYLDILTTAKDEKRRTYETMYQLTGISVSKLQRIFTGQQSLSTDDFELICEKGLDLDLDEVYARFGRQEFRDSEQVEYKGAKELLADFAKKEENLRSDYEQRLNREKEIVEFLKDLVAKSEAYNGELTKRAIAAEANAKRLDEKRHNVFWAMLGLVFLLVALLVLGIVLDLPHLGMGNCSHLH